MLDSEANADRTEDYGLHVGPTRRPNVLGMSHASWRTVVESLLRKLFATAGSGLEQLESQSLEETVAVLGA